MVITCNSYYSSSSGICGLLIEDEQENDGSREIFASTIFVRSHQIFSWKKHHISVHMYLLFSSLKLAYLSFFKYNSYDIAKKR